MSDEERKISLPSLGKLLAPTPTDEIPENLVKLTTPSLEVPKTPEESLLGAIEYYAIEVLRNAPNDKEKLDQYLIDEFGPQLTAAIQESDAWPKWIDKKYK